MASKICPNCGAKNPGTAYSCSSCAASLIDIPSASIPNSASQTTTASWSTQNPENYANANMKGTPSALSQTGESVGSLGQPLVTVRQSALSGIANALITGIFFLLFGFSAGLGSGGLLFEILYAAAVIAIPFALSYFLRPTYEFYDTSFQKVSRTSTQRWEYVDIQSVSQRRSRIIIVLKQSEGERFGRRSVAIPGNPKFSGTDLATWLASKIPPPPQNQTAHQEQEQESSKTICRGASRNQAPLLSCSRNSFVGSGSSRDVIASPEGFENSRITVSTSKIRISLSCTLPTSLNKTGSISDPC